MKTDKIPTVHSGKIAVFIVSLSAFILFTVALLFAFASDVQSQVLLSIVALSWFALVWCHISAVDNAFRSIRSMGIVTSLTGLALSFFLVWYQPTNTASLWIQLTFTCHVFSYMCAHYAYFLNGRNRFMHPVLFVLESTAIANIAISSIMAIVFILHDGNFTSTFFYRMFISFVALDVLSTVLYSILKRILVVSHPSDGPTIARFAPKN